MKSAGNILEARRKRPKNRSRRKRRKQQRSQLRERLKLPRQKTRRRRKKIWPSSFVLRTLRTAAASREAVLHSARRAQDSREHIRHRGHAPHRGLARDSREHTRHMGLVRDSREHVRYRQPIPLENVRRARRDRRRESTHQEKADWQETIRCVLRDRYKAHARQAREDHQGKADRQGNVRRVQRDRPRVHVLQEKGVLQGKDGQQETARHVLSAMYVLTGLRAVALLVKEGRDVRTEENEAGAIRERVVQEPVETGEIPAGKIWELLS